VRKIANNISYKQDKLYFFFKYYCFEINFCLCKSQSKPIKT